MLSRLPVLASIKSSAKLQVKRSYTEAIIANSLKDSMVEMIEGQDTMRLPEVEEGQAQTKAKRRKEDADSKVAAKAAVPTMAPKKPLQGWQLLQAIEKKNLMSMSCPFSSPLADMARAAIFEARDHAFPLLVTAHSGSLPLLYTLRIGASHRDIAILSEYTLPLKLNFLTYITLVTGALSKWVNNVDADQKPSVSLQGD